MMNGNLKNQFYKYFWILLAKNVFFAPNSGNTTQTNFKLQRFGDVWWTGVGYTLYNIQNLRDKKYEKKNLQTIS